MSDTTQQPDDEATRGPWRRSTAPNDPPPSEDFTIPGVVLGREIGRGGMAEVYEAEDRGFTPPRVVAVKLMDRTLSADPEFRTRFEREASIVASFRHDNIVHIYASGDVRGTKYIVMEFLPGGSLAQKLEQGPLPQREALETAARLADALAYSHACDIIHRDFKPGNVLFTAEHKPVLSDFGVAKSTKASDAALTRHASVIGALRYMAPEQERGEEVTDRADVFSFTLTLFEMLTGKLPPSALRVGAKAAELANLLPGLPASIVELISRGLAADPAARPSAREFEQLLDEHDLDSTRQRKSVFDAAGRGGLGGARGKLIWLGIGVVALVGLGVTIVLIVPPRHATTPPVPEARSVAPASTVRVAVVRSPESARTLIDAADVAGPSVNLTPGAHQLTALAQGYYGVVQSIGIDSAQVAPIEVRLAPVRTLHGADFTGFVDINDHLDRLRTTSETYGQEDAATKLRQEIAREIDAVPDPTFQAVLRSRLLRLSGQTAAANLLDEQMNTLAKLGDARAASALALSAAANSGRFTQDLVTPELQRASDQGDPLASFLIGVVLRGEVSRATPGTARKRALFKSYCLQLKAAVGQGWQELPNPYQYDCPQ